MKRILPHLTLSMAIAVAFITYLDDRNPMMGFLRSLLGRGFLYAFCTLTAVTCLVLIIDRFRKDRHNYRMEKRMEALKIKQQETESKD